MALSTSAISGAIIAAAQARYPGSQVTPRIASAVARSILSWISVPANVTVQGVTAGTAGTGTVNGKMLFSGAPNLVSAGLAQVGVSGPSSSGIGLAIGAGVLSALNASAQYTGTSAAVGTGSDTSKTSNANSATLVPILIANLQGQSVAGSNAPQFASGVAMGIANIVLTGTGIGGVVGSASPTGASGTSVSVIF